MLHYSLLLNSYEDKITAAIFHRSITEKVELTWFCLTNSFEFLKNTSFSV